MIPAAIDLATVFLIFFGWFALSFGAAVLIGKAIRGPQDFDADHPQRERIGIPSSPVAIDFAEREAKAQRAKFRHASRFGKDAA